MRLGLRSRTLLAASGATLAVAAFAMLPLNGNSSVASEEVGSVRDGSHSAPIDRRITLRLSAVNDPFARPLPADVSVISPQPRAVLRKTVSIRLRAIVAGRDPLALIDDGSSRIVRSGDTVQGVRIIAIDGDSVHLADGRAIRMDESPR